MATLADLGHQRIAFIDVMKTVTNAGYERGMRDELSERGMPMPDEAVRYGGHRVVDPEDEYVDRLVEETLDAPQRFTAVFCADDHLAERLYLAATHRGLRVGEDLSIIGYGPTFRGGPVRAGLAAVVVDEMELGRRAAAMLDEMRSGKRPLDDNQEIVLPVEVYRGKSLGPPSAD